MTSEDNMSPLTIEQRDEILTEMAKWILDNGDHDSFGNTKIVGKIKSILSAFEQILNATTEDEQCPEHIRGYCGCQNDRPPLKESEPKGYQHED